MKKHLLLILAAALIFSAACRQRTATSDSEVLSALQERFLRYVVIDTQSDEDSETTPSTSTQMAFARLLADECERIGLENVELSRHGIVTATLPSNVEDKLPVIGFISHLDTAPDASGTGVVPRIFEKYNGQDIVLDHGIVISPSEFPVLMDYIGQTIITASGDTLLGADDKAGITIILTAMEYLINNPQIPRREVRIAFTPDEEVGRGTEHFDVEAFGADFAFTVDGGVLGEFSYENFNAASARFVVTGRNIHPGDAKDIMVNSALIAMELALSFPADERPETTEGYDGFFFVSDISGDVSQTTLNVLIRTFDMEDFQRRKTFVTNLAASFNQRYGVNTVALDLSDSYYNMRDLIDPWIVEYAENAYRRAGVEPLIQPVRGGTDGAWLSQMGLPTPDIFTGAHNLHGPYEFVVLETMEKAVSVLVNLAGVE